MNKSLDLLGKNLDQDDLDLDENAPGYKGGEERDSQFRDVVAFNVSAGGVASYRASTRPPDKTMSAWVRSCERRDESGLFCTHAESC